MSASAINVTIADEILENPHRHNDEVHYRLYLPRDGVPTTVCVQSFDYHDYDACRFLTTDAFDDETAANRELNALLTHLVEQPEFLFRARISTVLATSGSPVTRDQALHAHLLRNLTDHEAAALLTTKHP